MLHIGNVIFDGKMVVSEDWKERERMGSYPHFWYTLTTVVRGIPDPGSISGHPEYYGILLRALLSCSVVFFGKNV